MIELPQDWIDRNIISSKIVHTGLFPILPKVAVLTPDDSFCRVVRDTVNIEIDKALRAFHRREFDEVLSLASTMGVPFNPEMAGMQDILHLIIMHAMLEVGANIERALSNMLWQGNPVKNTESGSYREFKGNEIQLGEGQTSDLSEIRETLETIHNTGEYVLVGRSKLVQAFSDELPAGFNLISDDFIPEIVSANGLLSSSLYAIPIGSTEKPITYLEYADYRFVGFKDNSMFWTDDGFYIWKHIVEGWDSKLTVKNECRLVMEHPELAYRFNLTYSGLSI